MPKLPKQRPWAARAELDAARREIDALRVELAAATAAAEAAATAARAANHATNASLDRNVGALQQLLWDLGERANGSDVRLDALKERADRLDARLDTGIEQPLPVLESLHLPPGTRRTAYRHAAGPRGVICTRATGAYLDLLALTVPAMEAYARTWGWDLVVSAENDLQQGRPSSWGKLPLIRDLAQEYDWVWWIDADAIVVDLEHDIDEHLTDDRDLLLVEHEFEWDYGDGVQSHRFPNFGIFVLRGGQTGVELCDALWAREDLIDAPWWENTAVLDALGYALYPMRPERRTPLLARTGFLPRAWNSLDDLDEDPAPIIKHHAGNAPFPERLRRTRDDLRALRAAMTRLA
jgi:hypothetical protein